MVNIKHARIDAGLTCEALGQLVGVSTSTVSQWESGKKNPLRSNLERLSEVLDVSVDYLLGKTEDPFQKAEGIDGQIFDIIKKLSPRKKVLLLQYLAGLSASSED